MIKNAESHADEARKLRELADARNGGESLAYATEKSLKDYGDKIDAGEAATIQGRIMELRGVLDSTDVGEIRAKTDALTESAHKLAEAAYAQASAQQASASGGNGSPSDDDEVVEDADYEVVEEEAK
jgi:molecular chaperone DnaK